MGVTEGKQCEGLVTESFQNPAFQHIDLGG